MEWIIKYMWTVYCMKKFDYYINIMIRMCTMGE